MLDARTDIQHPTQTYLRGDYVPRVCDREQFSKLIELGRSAFASKIKDPSSFGFLFAKEDRAFFQIVGDSTPYSLLIPDRLKQALVYAYVVKPRTRARKSA